MVAPANAGTPEPFKYLFGMGADLHDGGQLEVVNKDLTIDPNVPIGWPEYNAVSGEARIATGDIDGDGKDEIVIGFAPVGQSGLPGGRFEVLDDDFSFLTWGQVEWADYNSSNGETRPAVGDIDGDGKAEIVIGLGPGGGGLVETFRFANGALSPIGWADVNWPEYSQANGETWPTLGELDGDGRAALVIGLGQGGAGTFLVKKGFDAARFAAGQDPWIEELRGTLSWTDYATAMGETRPAVGDLTGDGTRKIVVGLGKSGGGNLEIFDYVGSSLVPSGSLKVDWPEYNAANGETRPVIGDSDGDRPAEIMVGLGRGGGGYVDLFDDAKAQFVGLDRFQLGTPAYQAANGTIWPAFKRERPPVLYQLSVLKNGTGTVGGGGRYVAGTRVAPTATAADGSAMAGWTPSSCGVTFALTADTTCSATFTQLPAYTLAAKLSGSGAVTSTPAGIYCGADCTAPYASGTAVALTPTPAIGYTFSGWSGACTGTGGCTVPMSAAKTVTATFKTIPGYIEQGTTATLADASQRQAQPLTAGSPRYLETRSARALTMGFDALDLAVATRDPAAYRLIAQTDPAYASPQPATRVGGDRQAVGVDGANQPVAETRLHLLLPYPLRPGVDYRLDACAAVGGSADPAAPCHALAVRYDPTLASGSIQVDQVGYAPGTTKIAYLGNWLGSAGPLPVDATGFEVVDTSSGESVFSGQARLTAAADPWSGNDVYQADFSTLERPGHYRLRVPGLGVSDPFAIAADVYDAPYRAALRLFYHARNGTAVVAPWAEPGYERPQGGVPPAMDAAFHAAVAGSPLSAGSTTDTGPTARHAVRHGWFDSDDYGQYVPNAAPVWYLVGAAMDLAPQRFGDGDLNIPESGNGIPDVLDELDWGLDWLLGMQDPADGGVWFRVGSRTWDSVPPYLIATPRLLFEKTSHATAAFAAACALHARLIRPYHPERADAALAAARRAWDFLASHTDWPAEGQRYLGPTGVRAADYSDVSARDNRLWAAAELYRTTGEASYRTAFETLMPQVKIDPTAGIGFQDVSLAGLWAYLLNEDAGKNTTLVKQASDVFIAAADWRVRNATAHPFRAPSHPTIGVVGWGSFGVSTRATLPLLQAYRLTGKIDYLDRAWQSPHPQLGANPQSLSYLPGFGARYPHFPLSKLTKGAGAGPGDPIKGLPVLGPQFQSSAEMTAMNAVYAPPAQIGTTLPTNPAGYAQLYPALRRYTDARGLPAMSKPTVVDYAQVGLAFGLLRRGGLKEEIDTAGKVQHLLTVTKNGTGSGTVGGGGRYAAGTAATATAIAADGSTFAGWTPSSCGTAVALNADTTCMATFTLLPKYALTVILSGSGTVTSIPAGINCATDCAEAYVSGTAVNLTMAPATGYLFSGWSGACAGTGGCMVAMGAVQTVTATFKAIPATVERGITSDLADASTRQIQPLTAGPARYVETRSARALTLGFDTLDLSVATRDPSLYTLTDPSDGSPQAATRVGGDRQVVGFDTAKQPQLETRLHLLFPTPLRSGVDYRLDACAALGSSADPAAPCHAMAVRYDPTLASGSIQVDQVGYAPRTTKIAFLGNWLGSAGPLPVDATGFEVVNAVTGESVFSGQAPLTAPADPWSGNDVYQADFTALDQPGRYRLRVPGLGVSDPFAITADVYDAPYRAALRLFYHARNSTPVVAPWAEPGYERPQGGVPPAMDAAFHAAVASSPLSAGSSTDTGPTARHAVSHGWFDAGDYGQYVPNAAPIWYHVGAALDLAPRRFVDGDLNIPESGNGIPDVLDELDWGMDWLLGMQDPADGGVWFRVASRNWDAVPPYLITTPRLLAEKTSHATAAFAGVCALHARLIRPYRPARADEALAAARRAWDFLASHPDWPAEGQRYKNPADVHAGDYSDASVRDNRLWAAAELFRTTGEAAYRSAFEALLPQVKIDPTAGVGFQGFEQAGLWAYLLADGAGKNPSVMAQARGVFIAAADWRIREANTNPFRAPTHHTLGLAGWGSFAVSTRATLALLQAYRLTGKTDYLDRAWQSPHPQLGANPQSLSYLTGFGARSPHFPLTKLNRNGVPGDPLKGIPVLGPMFHLPALWAEMIAVNGGYFPPEQIGSTLPTDAAGFAQLYPVLRRYTDARGVPPMSEPTVVDYAQVGLAFGLLRRGGLKEEIDALGPLPH
ncbi:glycoside hydrolase family 9 protein [uncultured Thiodictyon sp.]|uniref:glycoside hydrolase family 9 protein n=1 Tax=uncultured Thiodictyon sp. TaxID=1846217 RepID=UPI0025E777D3|nr:glycoside hydrolase family 9 protein [uncultured Thiodictyon sp.]